jgi:hypothetical protein
MSKNAVTIKNSLMNMYGYLFQVLHAQISFHILLRKVSVNKHQFPDIPFS